MDTLRSPDELREMGKHLFSRTEIRRTETRKDVERLKIRIPEYSEEMQKQIAAAIETVTGMKKETDADHIFFQKFEAEETLDFDNVYLLSKVETNFDMEQIKKTLVKISSDLSEIRSLLTDVDENFKLGDELFPYETKFIKGQ